MMTMVCRRHLFLALAAVPLLKANEEPTCIVDGICPDEPSSAQCKLFLAPSTIPNAGLGSFTAVPLQEDDLIGYGDVVFPLIDFDYHMGNDDYFDPFSEYVWNSYTLGMHYEAEDAEGVSAYAPGLDCAINCNLALVNVKRGDFDYDDGVGGHRSTSPSAGSMTPYHNGRTYAETDIPAGGELFKYYGDSWFETRSETFGLIPLYYDYLEAERLLKEWKQLEEELDLSLAAKLDVYKILVNWPMESRVTNAFPSTYQEAQVVMETSMRDLHQPNATRTMKELQTIGRCMDNIVHKPSTLEYAGRGAFATRALKKDEIITGTPALHLPTPELAMMYDEVVVGKRTEKKQVSMALWLNYCLSHRQTTAVVCPYGAGINYINHNQTLANVKIQWAPDGQMSQDASWLQKPPKAADNVYTTHLGMDYVATRDIAEGEELFLDYGDDWEDAWQRHLKEWKPSEQDKEYISATQWNKLYANEPIRTEEEQVDDPYPKNLMLRCATEIFFNDEEEWKGDHTRMWESWDKGHECKVLDRTQNEDDGEDMYTVEIFDEERLLERPWDAEEYDPYFTKVRQGVTREQISMADAPYSTDLHMAKAFRHYISMPDDMLPEAWITKEETETG